MKRLLVLKLLVILSFTLSGQDYIGFTNLLTAYTHKVQIGDRIMISYKDIGGTKQSKEGYFRALTGESVVLSNRNNPERGRFFSIKKDRILSYEIKKQKSKEEKASSLFLVVAVVIIAIFLGMLGFYTLVLFAWVGLNEIVLFLLGILFAFSLIYGVNKITTRSNTLIHANSNDPHWKIDYYQTKNNKTIIQIP
jgi:hypothetical protein